MKQTITRSRVLEIIEGYEVLKSLSGVKLAYAISKNMTALKREQENIKAATPNRKNLEDYDKQYNDLLNQEAKKDERGNLISAGGANVVIANPVTFTQKHNKLLEKHQTTLKENKQAHESFEQFLNEDFEFDFYQFKDDLIPETVTVEQMGLLCEMIEEQKTDNP